jgi:hypothetical protein
MNELVDRLGVMLYNLSGVVIHTPEMEQRPELREKAIALWDQMHMLYSDLYDNSANSAKR